MSSRASWHERVSHVLIDTRLERPARELRRWTRTWERIRYPELREIHLEDERFDRAMRTLIGADTNCVDVGCHLGSMTATMRRLAPRGRHFAYEPTPYKAEWLRRKFPDVAVRELALSDEAGEAEFFLQPRQSGFSGLRLHGSEETEFVRLRVEKARLDDDLPEDADIGFLKVDVEGGELPVLRGARNLLRRTRPSILFECTASGLAAFEIAPDEVYSFLTGEAGYEIFLVRTWLEGGEALSLDALRAAMKYPFQAFNFLARPLA